MPLHDRMAVETINALAGRREEIAERLIAPNGRRGDDERLPVRGPWRLAEDGRADVDRAANRPHDRRGVERRTNLVVRHRRPERGERTESRGQMSIHPARRLRPGHAGGSDRSVAAKAFE